VEVAPDAAGAGGGGGGGVDACRKGIFGSGVAGEDRGSGMEVAPRKAISTVSVEVVGRRAGCVMRRSALPWQRGGRVGQVKGMPRRRRWHA
jgi:hypothetical protein